MPASEDEYDSSIDMEEDNNSGSDSDGGSTGSGADDLAPESDGFANVLNKILNQNIGTKNPVLAKRKTQIMKDQEAHKKDKRAEKKRREDNKVTREKQMTMPGVETIDYERQLRKVSTRGVIALFNAIFQAKKDSEIEEDTKKTAGGKKRARDGRDAEPVTDVKQLTQERFLEMLKNGKQSSSSVRNADEAPRTAKQSKAGAADAEGATGGWNAIKDDYMIGQKISMKDWDKEVDSDNGGNYSDEDNFEEILDEADKKAKQIRIATNAVASGASVGGAKKKSKR